MAAAQTMTTSTTPDCSTKTQNSADPTSKSYFQRTVCLKDWWLVKAEKDFNGKRLAVAGVTSRENQAVRVFYTAPILRRLDVFTVETVDDTCVILNGFLDKAKTQESGFPSEVSNHFVFGFPRHWETYALDCLEGEPLTRVATTSVKDPGKSSPPQASERIPHPEDSSAESPKHVLRKSPRNITRKTILPSRLEHNDVHPSEQNEYQKEKDANSPRVQRNSSSCKRKIAVSPNHCEEIKEYNSSSKAVVESRKVGTRKRSSEAVNADHVGGSRSTNLLSESLKKQKDNPPGHGHLSNSQSSFQATRGSGCKDNATRNNTTDSCSRSISSIPVTGLEDLGNEVIPRTPDSRSCTNEGMNTDTKCSSAKARKSNKVLNSSNISCKAGNGRQNRAGACELSVSQSINFCKTRRQTSESYTSRKEKDESIVSPESLNLNRSRSGRLLLPRLEFWRNQRAIYDGGRKITWLKDLQISEPSKGSRSEPRRKN
ncbi:OLC1v1005378C3 [Oldenlandia corymbosa var. corymbosa]|uniref:OLC1v1005378C3 n=1 Tax=Oldenlandia corymbosa var. corymbosa TaxID=529605 RepID=A0AAV1DEG6_OLDCO|nr:OLC1v1005378C3 [Oldenlandia corymbosa var. corymbosa]